MSGFEHSGQENYESVSLTFEQWVSGSLDGRIDQYALGVGFYEMLAGGTLFQGESMEAMYVHHRETPLSAFAGNLQVPTAIQKVIRRATEKIQMIGTHPSVRWHVS
ncbi:MAG TPA: hypothetical protein DCE26_06890 [Dehalococcoidia bacterium]|nr:hypothetical protein [Dehalococcoidia bacterium]|tara:strand:+ start:767 stop:1084 length:318 start_codon:yes stop_codon:yes gene_type:complete